MENASHEVGVSVFHETNRTKTGRRKELCWKNSSHAAFGPVRRIPLLIRVSQVDGAIARSVVNRLSVQNETGQECSE